MKKFKKIFCFILVMCLILPVAVLFSACSKEDGVYIISFVKSEIESDDTTDVYLVTYSDGTTSSIAVKNGKDGQDGEDGKNGVNGKDGAISIDEVFAKYNAYLVSIGQPEITYAEFLATYLKANIDYRGTITEALNSAVKLYATCLETKTTRDVIGRESTTTTRNLYGGSGVIFKMDADYTYVITNFHVVYNQYEINNEFIAEKICGSLYGNEGYVGKKITATGYVTDDYGYVYEYKDNLIDFEYVGGSLEYDIAVIKTETSNILASNPSARAVTFADGYEVGEMCFAVGNPEGEGISATQGIISVDSEYVTFTIGSSNMQYRLLRTDTGIYHGSSGGALYNKDGKLIGITNGGNTEAQSINYAIPVNIVKSVAENLINYYNPASGETSKVKKIKLGIATGADESGYYYNESTKSGEIIEKCTIGTIDDGSIAKERLNLAVGDELVKFYIGKEETPGNIVYTEYKLNRNFNLRELLISVRADDYIKIQVKRSGELVTSDPYQIVEGDLVEADL